MLNSSATQAGLDKPLVIDLDGTLVMSDLLIEMTFGFLGRFPLEAYKIPLWLLQGKAVLKRRLTEYLQCDVTTLPYDEAVLETIRAARANGRSVYLASASDEIHRSGRC